MAPLVVGAVWFIAIALAVWSFVFYLVGEPGSLGMDARAYHQAGHEDQPYHGAPGDSFAVLYSPVFVQAMRALAWVPWPVFMVGWLLANAVAYWWLAAPLATKWRVPAFLLCIPAILIGNAYGLLAACFVAAVLGHTRSALGVVPLALTKITPAGVVGLWFLLRREWAALAVAVLTTVALAGVSFALDPGLWRDWFSFLASHSDDSIVRLVRMVAAVVLVVLVARRAPLWLLGVAFFLASPMASLVVQELVPLMVVPRLLAAQPRATAGESGASGRVSVLLEVRAA